MTYNIIRRAMAPLNRRRFRRFYDAETPVDLGGLRQFRGEAFPRHGPACWLDRPDAADRVAARLAEGDITAAQAEACRSWIADGYLVVPSLIDGATLDAAWADYVAAIDGKRLGEPRALNAAGTLRDRTLDPHRRVPSIAALQRHPAMLAWTDLLFGRPTIPFQTIMGHAGSQQAAHSDSIHMTTYPLGCLIASWLAFEDIHPDSGPLEYQPGSHRLPYLLSADVGIAAREYKRKGGSVYAERYEPAIRESSAAFPKRTFLARKGDALFWHANLVHGGSARADPDRSRKALVCHYFAAGAVTYHDLSGDKTRLHRKGMYAFVTP